MKEIVVLSGKGGTGKTSLVASFATLAHGAVLADCDVDAADMHLLLAPTVREENSFTGGQRAHVELAACIACGRCLALCRYDAISPDYRIDPLSCEGCGVCADHCPVQCISMHQEVAGQWFVSETRLGPLVHARLGIAQDNSGKLVAEVRRRARELAEQSGRSLILVDGPPGIGCPVISAVTGADLAVLIAEPTVSGEHDLRRVLELLRHFRLPAAVCVNKYDINEPAARRIEQMCVDADAVVVGRIAYDPEVTRAMIAGQTLPEWNTGPAATAVREIWETVAALPAVKQGAPDADL